MTQKCPYVPKNVKNGQKSQKMDWSWQQRTLWLIRWSKNQLTINRFFILSGFALMLCQKWLIFKFLDPVGYFKSRFWAKNTYGMWIGAQRDAKGHFGRHNRSIWGQYGVKWGQSYLVIVWEKIWYQPSSLQKTIKTLKKTLKPLKTIINPIFKF